jgi:long-chain acyl-CoA synthetase
VDKKLNSTSSYLQDVTSRLADIEARPLPSNLGELIDAAAAEGGDRIVWNFFEAGETETYEGMRQRVNHLAQRLEGIGIGKGSHVAVMLPNIPAFPLTWFALAKIGAVMIPVNTGYRERELGYVLGDSEAAFIVLHRDHKTAFEGARAHHGVAIPDAAVIGLGGAGYGHDLEEMISGKAERFTPKDAPTSQDLMNIQYTSGTTGFPKGCMLTHEYWMVAGISNAFRDGQCYDRLLASTPFYYMDPQWLLLMTLLHRGTLFVARKQSASRFVGWLREYDINFCLFPWIAYKQPPRADDRLNSVVRANIYGVPKNLHALIEERFGIRAREAFGMTELGPAIFMPLEGDEMVGSGFCGIPGPFRRCRVVNGAGEDVPAGEPGELLVSGRGIMQGYYRNPGATQAALIDGWFHTGDLFVKDENGFYRIIGRQKDMVRRSGENIAARELETVLNAFPGIDEAAIVPVPDEMRGEEVKACIVLSEGKSGATRLLDRIIAHCERELAAFKVPRFYEFRDALPRTGSSKVAKRKLQDESGDPRAGCFDRVTGKWV